MIKNDLEALISEKKARIGVIGLGYVGLPLIVEFCLKGFEGIGFEVDEKRTEDVNTGRSYIVEFHEKIELQNAADSAAYSLATLEARSFNFIAFVVFPLHVAHTIGKAVWLMPAESPTPPRAVSTGIGTFLPWPPTPIV